MSVVTINRGGRSVQVESASAAQASVDALTVLSGSEMDLRPWQSLSYALKVATNAISWTVYGANLSDYSDEVIVQVEAMVTAGSVGTYVVAQTPYGFYRVKIRSTMAGIHGTATINGLGKAA